MAYHLLWVHMPRLRVYSIIRKCFSILHIFLFVQKAFLANIIQSNFWNTKKYWNQNHILVYNALHTLEVKSTFLQSNGVFPCPLANAVMINLVSQNIFPSIFWPMHSLSKKGKFHWYFLLKKRRASDFFQYHLLLSHSFHLGFPHFLKKIHFFPKYFTILLLRLWFALPLLFYLPWVNCSMPMVMHWRYALQYACVHACCAFCLCLAFGRQWAEKM